VFDAVRLASSSSATTDAKGHMKEHREYQIAAQATGRAIQAIEHQMLVRMRSESAATAAKRQEFFALLDGYRERLFSSIEAAVKRNERVFYPATVPGFAARCDKIFNIGVGDYNHEMLNGWLHANDLKHVFHAEPGGAIRW
jgi:hypothetical protein